ncbi:MAG: phosphoribosylformylglycinamidine synthase subunit PurS [Deltaproteobacteria bacterium]|nr:MAG: phosphoribosylformylglycinamidine synthase subunit PurS [Deltaproteobacteria bacterium]
MRARVYVTLKPAVLDPQGQVVQRSLHTLGYEEVAAVRIGKLIDIEVQATTQEEARARLEEMCERLLANTLIEDYRIEVA